ncbi:MAG: alpha/beta fold hydrolase [Janthinobacterium lividum]
MLLHYFGGSARSWEPLTAVLGGHCLAPDLRGFGDAPPGGPMRVADYADDAMPLLRDGCILVGHSMGGKVALTVAARRPPGLRGLVLVAPSPPGPEPMTDDSRTKLRAAWNDPEAAQELARTISRHGDGPAFDRIVADHLRASQRGWLAWLDEGSKENLCALAEQVAVPVLVVAGAEDEALGPDVQERETMPSLPSATLHIIAGSRHLIPLDAPEQLGAAITGWTEALADR